MAATCLVRKLGVDHNHEALQWRDQFCSSHFESLPHSLSAPQLQLQTCESQDQQEELCPPAQPQVCNPSGDTQTESNQVLSSSSYPHYLLVGDNLDKNISPRDMRVGNQVKSLHYFHSYAVHDRIDVSDLSDDQPKNDIQSLPVTTFVPSADDCTTLRSNYIVLVARVIVDKLPYFSSLHKCVVQHIPHRYSKAMEQKSKIVSNLHLLLLDCIYMFLVINAFTIQIPLGVIPKNENKRDEMAEILEELQKNYCPCIPSDDGSHPVKVCSH